MTNQKQDKKARGGSNDGMTRMTRALGVLFPERKKSGVATEEW
jgi:hypothetical protein